MKKVFIFLILSIFLLASCTQKFDGTGATIYKTISCGCCGLYKQHLSSQGLDTTVVDRTDITDIKEKYKIPTNLQSCHTTVIDDYFVEGHIPAEAIEKLLTEKPDIAGIAMPGMPSGSPGMPGAKKGDFVIYAVNHDGSTYEFIRI